MSFLTIEESINWHIIKADSSKEKRLEECRHATRPSEFWSDHSFIMCTGWTPWTPQHKLPICLGLFGYLPAISTELSTKNCITEVSWVLVAGALHHSHGLPELPAAKHCKTRRFKRAKIKPLDVATADHRHAQTTLFFFEIAKAAFAIFCHVHHWHEIGFWKKWKKHNCVEWFFG